MKRRQNTSQRVLAYARVSTEEQAESGLGLGAQRSILEAEAARRGWADVAYLVDEVSAKNLQRPALAGALKDLAAGRAGVLVVSKLDRLCRSLRDFVDLMAQALAEGWQVVSLDIGVDMTTPQGRLVANLMACVAEWEREVIAQRTRDALAVRRAQGLPISRPTVPADVAARIVAMRQDGLTYQAIADALDAEGVPTARGAPRWRPSAIQSTLRRAEVAA